MIGKILDGRYEVISLLGEGSFGTTYLAIDRKLPDKDQCVVKHFSPKSTDPNTLYHARRLFETEAKVLNRLGSHDRIPRLLAHFEEDQQFYVIEEFVAGHDLSREINPQIKYTQDQVITLLQDILDVLEFVHQNNVIHRDIKPSNLMRRQQDGKIVLIDFGAVKQISYQAVNAEGHMTATVIVGTPGYIASEQSQGQPRMCSDIYAVGIMGIQAITGLSPIQLPRDRVTNEIIWRDQAQVSQQFADILDKMVKYDFRQRYQSVTEVLQALQDLSRKNTPNKSIPRIAVLGGLITAIAAISAVLLMFKPSNNNFALYQNSAYGINIKYPQAWQKNANPDRITGNLVKFTLTKEGDGDPYLENTNLLVKDLPENPQHLGQLTELYLNEIKESYPNLKIIESRNTKLANQPAYQVIYSFPESGVNIQRLQVWLVKNNRMYIFTYSAEAEKYAQYLPIVQTMLDSLEIN